MLPAMLKCIKCCSSNPIRCSCQKRLTKSSLAFTPPWMIRLWLSHNRWTSRSWPTSARTARRCIVTHFQKGEQCLTWRWTIRHLQSSTARIAKLRYFILMFTRWIWLISKITINSRVYIRASSFIISRKQGYFVSLIGIKVRLLTTQSRAAKWNNFTYMVIYVP